MAFEAWCEVFLVGVSIAMLGADLFCGRWLTRLESPRQPDGRI